MFEIALATIVPFLLTVMLLATCYYFITYRVFLRLRSATRESWKQVDDGRKRRRELIPVLVETVRGFAAHERETFDTVMKLRDKTMDGKLSVPKRAQAETALSDALQRLLAIAEACPGLKSSADFQGLLEQLADAEDRIATGQQSYNDNVRVFNTKAESFPAHFVAKMMNLAKFRYFELEESAKLIA